jgi:hypothetical protein
MYRFALQPYKKGYGCYRFAQHPYESLYGLIIWALCESLYDLIIWALCGSLCGSLYPFLYDTICCIASLYSHIKKDMYVIASLNIHMGHYMK